MMTTLERILKPIKAADAAKEHFTFRVQDGVEIYESEYVRATKISRASNAVSLPRLVVEEEGEAAPALLFTKKRSELREILHRLNIVTV